MMRYIKLTILTAFMVLVGVIFTTPKINAFTQTTDTEIVYIDYKGIYMSPNDYKNGEALTYEQYYQQAFGQYVNTGIAYFRLETDTVYVVFIPMNYTEIDGLSVVGVDKLEMIKVGYTFDIDSELIIDDISITHFEVFARNLVSSYSNVDSYVFTEINKGNVSTYINNVIASMPNIENEHQSIYDDGYGVGYDDGYDVGYGDGFYDGYDDGYGVGCDDGYDVGYGDGFYDGYDDGRADYGEYFPPGSPDGFDGWYGFQDGYDYGYDKGYDKAFDDNNTFNFTALLAQIFVGMGSLLAINLLPGISIGAIVAVPLVFGIIYFIIGKRSGDD